LPPTKSPMAWGFQCNDGWFWLIRNLCELLQFDIDRNGELQLEANTVKQKFGTLRFYTDGCSKRQEGMIALAEFMSHSICENCGSTKDVSQNKKGFIQNLCKECWRKRNDKSKMFKM